MSPLILIADGLASRRRRLVEAFHASDLEVEAVGDGASALELALSERPELILAETELPLVEAPKLAEILRANPRTRAARFVFMGGHAAPTDTAGLSDVFLAPDATISDIVSMARSEFAIQKRLIELNRVMERGERPTGRFPDLPLLEVMHSLHLWKCSGRLDLRRDGNHDGRARGSVWLLEGQVVDAALGDVAGRKALYRMMSWERGTFALDPSGVHVKSKPLGALRPLLKEGSRQLCELSRVSGELPSIDSTATLRVQLSDLPTILHPLTQEVLSLLERHETVGQVVDHCSYPDYQVLRTLSTLADRQIIDLGPSGGREASDGELFDASQIRRLKEWALIGPVQSADADLKLLVAASGRDALVDFTGLLRGLPGASLSRDFAAGAVDPECLAPVGRLDIEGGIGIEFVNVPTSAEMAPLWTVVGSGALGTLFVLAGDVAEAATRVEAMAEAMRTLPQNRIFNLYLNHKEDPVSAEDLGDNLALIEAGSLFVVPLEGEPPLALMRTVFGRVVP